MLHYVVAVVCLSLLLPFRPLEDPSPLIAAFIRRLAQGLEYSQDRTLASQAFIRAAKADETTVGMAAQHPRMVERREG